MAAQPQSTVATVNVASTATALSVYGGKNFIQRTFVNIGAVAVYLGGLDVTASGATGGARILAGGWVSFADKTDWYGITASSTANVVVIESTNPVDIEMILSVFNGPTAASVDITSALNTLLAAGIAPASVTASGLIKSTSPTAGIGYAVGSGGSVTQATDKTTGVTSNTITTAVTLNNASLAAATIVAFTFTNSAIGALDTVICEHASAGTSGAYTINAFPGSGSAVVSVRNNTAGALAEAIVLRITVIKSVST